MNQPTAALRRLDGAERSPVQMEAMPSGPVQLRSLDDVARLGETLARSGYFKDTRDAAQAVVKVLYGAELGISPVQAMMGVHIIEGKPAPGAGLVAALVKRSGKYTYRAKRHDATGCVLEFFERIGNNWQSLGEASFIEADAKRAGLGNRGPWKSYPQNMYFARALTNGARFYCPDIFGGSVYVPEELGADVDGEGNVKGAPEASPKRLGSPGEDLYAGPEPEAADVVEAEVDVVDEETGEVLETTTQPPASDVQRQPAPATERSVYRERILKASRTVNHLRWTEFEEKARLAIEGWPVAEAADIEAAIEAAEKRVKLAVANDLASALMQAQLAHSKGLVREDVEAPVRRLQERCPAGWIDFWPGALRLVIEEELAPQQAIVQAAKEHRAEAAGK